MFPTEFAYQAPTTLDEVLTLLASGDGSTKLLAGGQSLLPVMKMRLASPSTLVDIGRIPALRGIREEGDAVVIGATTTYRDVLDSQVAAQRVPVLVEAIRHVGDMQVRSRGTIGGSLAHADPAGDLPAVALALNAEMSATGANGNRTIAADRFFVDLLTTALTADEVLTAIRFQATNTPGTGTAYIKHAHPASGYAVVGVAALVRLGADGACQEARVAITGAGSHAARATAVEQALAGRPLDAATLAAATANAAQGLDLLSDSYASADYRAHLAGVLARRALTTAAERAR
ncbi:MAG TPA: xanthine dehydrogenase family protein subunit M [Ktedonobacterales bacterium]|nr:xanthine dehydrogenase family protein subunit M [Ktedonobacterales bacterium]